MLVGYGRGWPDAACAPRGEVDGVSGLMREHGAVLDLRQPVFVSVGQSLRDAARALWLEDVGAVVVQDGDRPVGILSERDLVNQAANGSDFDAVRVGEVMTAHFIAARPEDTVQDAAYQMLEQGFRHLPIEDGSGRLIGMVSINDLLRPWMADQMQKHLA